jgi:acetyl esterase/lipase
MPLHAFLAVLLIVAMGCDANGSDTPRLDRDALDRVRLQRGIHRDSVSLGNGAVLRFTIAVPPLPQGARVPFVMALHYAGRIHPYFAEDYLQYLVEPALRDLGAIIVAPDVPGPAWVDPYSVEAVLQFIDAAKAVWPVDPERVVVTGYSMGGIGTWFLADQHSDKLSAGIPIAADPIGTQQGTVPLYVIHGRDDELFDLATVEFAVADLRAKGVPVELVVVEDRGHYEAFRYVDALRGAVAWLENTVWNQP